MKKIGNSFKGILGGFVFIIIAIVALWWNEGNNVKNIKTTKEMEELVVDISSDKIDSAYEGKLIATHGKLLNEETLEDKEFEVSLVTPKLVRNVEMYQWEEDSSTDDDGNTTYSYSKKWSSTIIDSGNFHNSGHENPAIMPYHNETYIASDVKVGAFTLNTDQKNDLSTNKDYRDLKVEVATRLNYTIADKYYTSSQDISNPEIGDVRISFVYNDSTDVSILAVQIGDTFTEYTSSVGKKESRIMDGIHTGKDMINVIKKENNLIKWIIRAAGTLFIILGFATILKPISTITGYVPILGSIVSGVVGIVSFILGVCLSLVVIAIAWIRFRPILGICLLAAVVALFILLKKVLKKKKENAPSETVVQSETPEVVPNTPQEVEQPSEENHE